MNFASMEAKQSLHVVDCFSSTSLSLSDLFHAIASFSKAQTNQDPKQEPPVSVVIDDLGALKWQFGIVPVLKFVRCCKTLTHPENGRANVVVLSHTDTEPSSALSFQTAKSLASGLFR